MCIRDRSGTSASPSILNASPESAAGGGLSLLHTNDIVRIDLHERSVNMLVDEAELERRKKSAATSYPADQTPWQNIYRTTVGQLAQGACVELAETFHSVTESLARDNH